jgi:hypothetical protein
MSVRNTFLTVRKNIIVSGKGVERKIGDLREWM